jgi:hypothetical protein
MTPSLRIAPYRWSKQSGWNGLKGELCYCKRRHASKGTCSSPRIAIYPRFHALQVLRAENDELLFLSKHIYHEEPKTTSGDHNILEHTVPRIFLLNNDVASSIAWIMGPISPNW